MQALDDVIRSGKVRYIGASSMWAWQFAQAQHYAKENGWTRFISMQDQYGALYSEEEREMHPFCEATGVGVVPWSPLARGKLVRPPGTETVRSENDAFGFEDRDSDARVVEAVFDITRRRDLQPSEVALAWVMRSPAVKSPIVGATKPHHLTDARGAMDVALADDEVAALEQWYRPRPPAPFS